jgi:uncharacterized integral membrane protein
MVKRKRTRVKAVVPSISRLSSYAFGHSFGLVSVLGMLLYTIMAWFSNFNPAFVTNQYPLSFSVYDWTLIVGLLQTYVLGYIGGWIFAKIYNQTVM